MTYYLSGPMSGMPDLNRHAFESACVRLRDMGKIVVSPHEAIEPGESWLEAMRKDLYLLLNRCDGIILLPGWTTSSGAWLELTLARAMHLPVYFYLPQPLGCVIIDMQTGCVA